MGPQLGQKADLGPESGPRPESTAAEVLAYATGHAGLMSLGAALLFGSAFPLVVYAVTALRRLRRLGVAAPGPLMGSPARSSPRVR